jgi:putative hydrolase of the HAD superfamily
MIEWIAFDADDTLWENEVHYRRGRELFDHLMQAYPAVEDADQVVHRIEIANLVYYGYGAQGFILSLIEAAVELTAGAFSTQDTLALLNYLKEMLSARTELLDGAREVLEDLADDYPLALITKGDLRHQQAKVAASGLADTFKSIEVVSDKRAADYRSILEKLGLQASSFLMVGNSLPSDVIPVLELGGWAVYVPNRLTWSHEHLDSSTIDHPRFFEVGTLREVPETIRGIAKGA